MSLEASPQQLGTESAINEVQSDAPKEVVEESVAAPTPTPVVEDKFAALKQEPKPYGGGGFEYASKELERRVKEKEEMGFYEGTNGLSHA